MTTPPPNLSQFIFHDPSFFQWFFFRQHKDLALVRREQSAASSPGPDQTYLRDFWDIVCAGAQWADAFDELPSTSPRTEFTPRRNQRIYESNWRSRRHLMSNGEERFYTFEARSFLDTLFFNLGQTQDGDYHKDQLPTFTVQEQRFTTLPTPGGFFIGEANCLVAECPEINLSKDEWRARVDPLIEKWLLLPDPEQHRTFDHCFEHGYFAYVADASKPTFILLYPQRNPAKIRSILYENLPHLALACLKLRAIEKDYDEQLNPTIGTTRIMLEELVEKTLNVIQARPLSLDNLETQSTALAKQLVALRLDMEPIESHLQSLQVNVRNLEKLCTTPAWGNAQPMTLPPRDEMEQLVHQIESDLHYKIIVQKNAETLSGQLQTLTNIQLARNERELAKSDRQLAQNEHKKSQSDRLLAIALALFGVMSAPQVFPNSPWRIEGNDKQNIVADNWWKIYLTVGSFFLLIFLYIAVPRVLAWFSSRRTSQVPTHIS